MYDVIHDINMFTCCARLTPRTARKRRRETSQISDLRSQIFIDTHLPQQILLY